MGLPRKKRRRKRRSSSKKKSAAFIKSFDSIVSTGENDAVALKKKLALLKSELFKNKYQVLKHSRRLAQYQKRYDSTPSIWPVYGYIKSRYGWRIHPKTGRSQFHKGIDIASWTGAPVQVTADGIVEYAGWSRTFGYVVVVDHNYGYRTIYAHCSQIITKKGSLVKKGEVIAQVGSTGLSTGPHLHYEIRKWRKVLNPIAYLDLDMFTARRRVW